RYSVIAGSRRLSPRAGRLALELFEGGGDALRVIDAAPGATDAAGEPLAAPAERLGDRADRDQRLRIADGRRDLVEQPGALGRRIALIAEDLLQLGEAAGERARRVAAEAVERLERIAQALRVDAQAVQRARRRRRADAASPAPHLAQERAHEV